MPEQLADTILNLMPRHSQSHTVAQPLPGVTLFTSDCSVTRCPNVYDPRLCFIARGRKSVFVGDKSFDYDQNHYLLNSVTMPVEFELEKTDRQRPFVGLSLDLNDQILGPLLSQMNNSQAQNTSDNTDTLQAAPMTERLHEALLRLLGLAEDPDAASVLSEGIWREIYFEVLRGPSGKLLYNRAANDFRANRLAPVIDFIDQNFEQKLDIETIAAFANMSPSTLHEHFKQVTALSPMQYLKNLRLHRAHAMILAGQPVNQACFAVGYQSPSQFSREFKRFFGLPPSEASVANYTEGAMV
ncbi:MAG: AraC family transcriptional regulator N-terminal domain-containing protein [Granulosicoccaceae bacterium]